MNPSISSIPSTATDQDLSAAVAQHCAGWKLIPDMDPHDPNVPWCWWNERNEIDRTENIPPYATDANCVMPLLETYWVRVTNGKDGQGPWSIDLRFAGDTQPRARGHGETFSKAACFALLRASGLTVTE